MRTTNEVAAALESAAERVAKRGAPVAAAELLELAIRKTPPSDPTGAARRRVELVELTLRAGDTDEAKRKVALVLDAVPQGSLRARALEQRARINVGIGDDVDAAERDALVALELLRQVEAPDPVVEVEVIQARIGAMLWQGRPLRSAVVRRHRLKCGLPSPMVGRTALDWNYMSGKCSNRLS
jgi:hypothetical protein